jgi:hypothetical protein
VKTGVKLATKMYNKHNELKLRVMNALYVKGCLRGSNQAMTCKEINKITGIPSEYISRLFSRLKKIKANYFIRLKPKANREYRYQLSKLGVKWYRQYILRFYSGFDLNCVRAQPRRLGHYTGARITKEQLNELAGKWINIDILKRSYLAHTKAGIDELERMRAEKAATI